MEVYGRSTALPHSAERAFAWHERSGALDRLLPPRQRVETLRRTGTIRDGDRVTLRVLIGPCSVRWTLQHEGYRQGEAFEDRQLEGPGRSWHHRHLFRSTGESGCELTDRIEYELGGLSVLLGRAWQRHRLGGHEVVRLVRRPPMSPAEITWDPATGQIDADALEGFDAVIHLTGENIGAGLAHARLGPVRSPRAGMLKRLLPVFRAGAGGVVGGGRQPISWIGLDDAIGALHLLMGDDRAQGAFNVVAPVPTPGGRPPPGTGWAPPLRSRTIPPPSCW